MHTASTTFHPQTKILSRVGSSIAAEGCVADVINNMGRKTQERAEKKETQVYPSFSSSSRRKAIHGYVFLELSQLRMDSANLKIERYKNAFGIQEKRASSAKNLGAYHKITGRSLFLKKKKKKKASKNRK